MPLALFSCSFAAEDQALNEFFLCICEGLGIVARNVSAGYCVTPPEMARRLIPGSIVNSAWAESVPPGATEKIKHSIECKPSRADLRPTPAVIKDTPQQLTIEINFGGEPQENDTLDVDFSYWSPNLNHWPDLASSDHKQTKIDGQFFDCFDGMIPIQPTRELHVQFRFPGWYPLDKSSIFPFVGSYSNNVDYVVDSEVKRCEIRQSEFGSEIQIDIKVESPLLRHVYGVAWRLLSEEASELNHLAS